MLDNATSMSNLLTAIVDWTSATSDASEPVLVSTDVLDMCRRTVGTSESGYAVRQSLKPLEMMTHHDAH